MKKINLLVFYKKVPLYFKIRLERNLKISQKDNDSCFQPDMLQHVGLIFLASS